jgi:hypothetical protein
MAANQVTAGDGPDGHWSMDDLGSMDDPAHVATCRFSPKRSNGER